GMLLGGGLVWIFRFVFSKLLRKEAMGTGDIALLAMIGSFLGWQAAVLTFFLAPFFGLAHALLKLVGLVGKWLRGRQFSVADREMFFGPYLSLAAAGLLFAWPWLWPAWGARFFETLRAVFWFLWEGNLDPIPAA
ncbi:MAG: prepilin peptidase, partial [Isosphaeraceae bacterium]|nr:prepilin peptidase [Isosphaeraceae bacterium]